VFGCEDESEAAFGLLGEPRLGLPGDVSGVIVENDLDGRGGRRGGERLDARLLVIGMIAIDAQNLGHLRVELGGRGVADSSAPCAA
jgi:hypothetical protein